MSAYELDPQETDDPGIVHVSLGGELDLTNAQELHERLEALVSNGQILVLDLNRVAFIDSAAIHVFFKLARWRGPHGLAIVVEPSAPVARTLAIAALDDVVPVGPSA
ncbi:MAG TPA: STAS domain-containing protein [Gaiellaceae bacterium]|nr:STAS domain-containing protein [Gaiellaceae bacterium]